MKYRSKEINEDGTITLVMDRENRWGREGKRITFCLGPLTLSELSQLIKDLKRVEQIEAHVEKTMKENPYARQHRAE